MNPCALLGGKVNRCTTVKNSVEVPQKIEIELQYDPAIPHWAYIIENRILKRYLHIYVHCDTVHDTQDVEAT